MVKVSRAQIYLKVGLGLDLWANAIIDGSRNSHLMIVDCSQGVRVLEVPTGRVDASMGDVHPSGNPHYWLDPRNGAVVGRNIAEGLARVDPAHADQYRARAEAFAKEAETAWQQGQEKSAALAAKVVFTYHRSWSYLADAFGLEVAGTAEPFPGIPPTARHLADLVEIAKLRRVQLLLQEPYFSDDAARFLGREAGVRAAVVAPSCDAPTAGSYLAHFAAIFHVMAQAAGKS
jgi:ABC-type Zn uptake system ZnuABC Zn-binding protein ZnuA